MLIFGTVLIGDFLKIKKDTPKSIFDKNELNMFFDKVINSAN